MKGLGKLLALSHSFETHDLICLGSTDGFQVSNAKRLKQINYVLCPIFSFFLGDKYKGENNNYSPVISQNGPLLTF